MQDNPAKHRVLIVDDHPIVRQGYVQLIDGEPDLEVCGTADSQAEALDLIVSTTPHLMVVDLTLKDCHGIELVKRVRQLGDGIKMLVVSAHDENVFAERVLEAGASGYLNKQEATEKLIDGIHAVARGEVFLSEAMTRRLLKRRISGEKIEPAPSIGQLSDRELTVFEFIGEGLSTREIAARMNLSHKTIERYKENIKQKLNLAGATELVQRATQWKLEGG